MLHVPAPGEVQDGGFRLAIRIEDAQYAVWRESTQGHTFVFFRLFLDDYSLTLAINGADFGVFELVPRSSSSELDTHYINVVSWGDRAKLDLRLQTQFFQRSFPFQDTDGVLLRIAIAFLHAVAPQREGTEFVRQGDCVVTLLDTRTTAYTVLDDSRIEAAVRWATELERSALAVNAREAPNTLESNIVDVATALTGVASRIHFARVGLDAMLARSIANPVVAVGASAVRAIVARTLGVAQRTTIQEETFTGPTSDYKGVLGLDGVPDQATDSEPKPRYVVAECFDGAEGKVVPGGQWLAPSADYILAVAISPTIYGIRSKGDLEPVDERTIGTWPLIVFVSAQISGGTVEGSALRTVRLPRVGSSTTARFRFRTESDPIVKVELRFYHEACLIEAVVVRLEVSDSRQRWYHYLLNRNRQRIEQVRYSNQFVSVYDVRPCSMQMDITRLGDTYLFDVFLCRGSDKDKAFTARTRIQEEDLTAATFEARRTLEEVARAKQLSTPDAGVLPDDVLRSVAEAGRKLFDLLFRTDSRSGMLELGQWLETSPLAFGSRVQVTVSGGASTFHIPWALLYTGRLEEPTDIERFWGIRHVVEVLNEGLQPAGGDGHVLSGPNLGFFLWGAFKNGVEHETLLRSLTQPNGSISAPIEDRVSALGRMKASCDDVLYFYAHGHAARPGADGVAMEVWNELIRRVRELPEADPVRAGFGWVLKQRPKERGSWIRLTNGTLTLADIYRDVYDLPQRPVVFLNMCESGFISPLLHQSFAHVFLDRGALAVIGTECVVSVHFAHPFGADVLWRWFGGMELGEAIRSTRMSFMRNNNPLGLAYSHVGHASVTIAAGIRRRIHMALYDAALPVVEKLLRSDEDALFERLGILSLQLRRDLATGASFDPQLEHDAAIMGPLDEVRDLGQRLFVRLEREAHALVCGSSEIDLRDREDLRSAFGLTEAAIAATLSAALVAHLGVAAPIAAVVAAIVIRRVGAAGHDVFCVRWKERLSG